MMGLQNLCTLFGPTLMKLSPKDNLQAEDMNKEIKESMQQAQVLFYILQLHSEDKLINDINAAEIANSNAHNNNNNKQNNQQTIEQLNTDNEFDKSSSDNMSKFTSQSSKNTQQLHQTSKLNIDKNNNNLPQQSTSERIAKLSMQTAL